jgi:hypothetical protein
VRFEQSSESRKQAWLADRDTNGHVRDGRSFEPRRPRTNVASAPDERPVRGGSRWYGSL